MKGDCFGRKSCPRNDMIFSLQLFHPFRKSHYRFFISTKLARRFIADDPPQQLIEKAAQTFLNTKGDIKSVLRVILLDGLNPKGFQKTLGFVSVTVKQMQTVRAAWKLSNKAIFLIALFLPLYVVQ